MTYQQLVLKHKKLFFIILMGLVLIIGVFFRANSLGSESLWIDEGYSLNAVLAIQEHSYPLLDSGQFYGQGLGFNYITSLSMGIFGFDPFSPWSARLPSVVFGIFTAIAGFFLASILFPRTSVPWITSIFITLSSWEILWSRQVRGYIALQFFIILSLYFFFRWLKNKAWVDFSFFVLLFIASYLSHSISLIFIPAFIVIFILHTILHPEKIKSIKNILIAGIIGAVIFATILWLSDIKLVGYDYSKIYLGYLFKDLLPFTVFSMIALVVAFFDKRYFWSACFLSSVILIPLVIIMEYGQLSQVRYLFPLFPFFIILVSYLISTILQLIKEKLPKLNDLNKNIPAGSSLFLLAIDIIFIVLILIIFGKNITFTPKIKNDIEWDSPKPDFKSAYTKIAEMKKEDDLIISPYAMMSKIYLGESGLLLPISLSGKKSALEKIIMDGKDYYTGAPIISNDEQLIDILERQEGFVLLDGMACNRLGENCNLIAKYKTVKQVYGSGGGLNGIGVFYFKPKDEKSDE